MLKKLSILYYNLIIIAHLVSSSVTFPNKFTTSTSLITTTFKNQHQNGNYSPLFVRHSNTVYGLDDSNRIDNRIFSRLLSRQKRFRSNDSHFNTSSTSRSSNSTRFSRVNIFTIKSNFKTVTLSNQTTKQKRIDCLITNENNTPVKSVLSSPTVVKANAIEKFKYYSANKLKTFSILFKIDHVFKLNNQILDNNSSNGTQFSQPLINSSLQQFDLNSYILIENFNQQSTDSSSCYSIDIKLNRTYYLFLNNQTEQKYFQHPIRFKSATVYPTFNTVFLKIPILNMAAPIDSSQLNETIIRSSLTPLKVKFDKRTKTVQLKQNVKLVCLLQVESNTIVVWKKNRNYFIKNSTKFQIETNRK